MADNVINMPGLDVSKPETDEERMTRIASSIPKQETEEQRMTRIASTIPINQELEDNKFKAWKATNSGVSENVAADVYRQSQLHPEYSTELITNNLEELKKQSEQEKLTAHQNDSPGLSKWMQNPQQAAIVKNDTDALRNMEAIASQEKWWYPSSYYKEFNRGLEYQDYSSASFLYGLGFRGSTNQQIIDKFESTPSIEHENWPLLAKGFGEVAKMTPFIAGSLAAREVGAAAGAKAIPGGIGKIGGAAVGQFTAGVAYDFMNFAGPFYRRLATAKDEDGNRIMSDTEARNLGFTTALGVSFLTAGLENILFKRLLGHSATEAGARAATDSGIKIAYNWLKRTGINASIGAAFVAVQSAAIQSAEEFSKLTHGKNFELGNVWNAATQAWKDSFTSMAIIGQKEAGMKFLIEGGRYVRMHMDNTTFSAEAKNAQESSTIKNHPDIMERVADETIKNNPTMNKIRYVDFEGWDKLYGDEAKIKASELMQDNGKAYDEGKATGSIAIPYEKYISHLAASKESEQLQQISKSEPDGYTFSQKAEVEAKIQKQLEQIDLKSKEPVDVMEEAVKSLPKPDEINFKSKEPEYAEFKKSKEEVDKDTRETLFRKLKTQESRQNSKEFKAEFEGEKTDALNELVKSPKYRALEFLRGGKFIDEQGVSWDWKGGGLNYDSIRDDSYRNKKDYPRGIWGNNDISFMAEAFGYKGTNEFLDSLKETTPYKSVTHEAEEVAKARMWSRYGLDLFGNVQTLPSGKVYQGGEKLMGEVMKEVYSDKMAERLIREMRLLQHELDPEAPANRRNLSFKDAVESAQRILRETPLRSIDPRRYLTGLISASNRAFKAYEEGSKEIAYREKEYQLNNLAKWKIAKAYSEAAEGFYNEFKRYSNDLTRARLGKADPVLRNMHDALLDTLGIRDFERGTNENLGAANSYEQFLDDRGFTPEIVDLAKDIIQNKTPWHKLTYNEALNVSYLGEQIRGIARDVNKFNSLMESNNLNELLSSMKNELVNNEKYMGPKTNIETAVSRLKHHLQAAKAANVDIAVLAHEFGPTWYKVLISSGLEGLNKYQQSQKEILTAWRAAGKDFLTSKQIREWDKPIKGAENWQVKGADGSVKLDVTHNLKSLSSLILAMGTEHSKQSVLSGYDKSEAEAVKFIGEHTTPEFLQYHQKLFDFFENYFWPKISADAEKINHIPPIKEKAVPITIKFKDGREITIPGGYSPTKYDLEAARIGQKSWMDEQGGTPRVTHRMESLKSYQKERVTGYKDIPDLNRNILTNVSQIAYDLAFGEPVREIRKVFRDQDLKDKLYQYGGVEKRAEIEKYVDYIDAGHPDSVGQSQKVLWNWIRGSAASKLANQMLAWSSSVLFTQLAHFPTTMVGGIFNKDLVSPRYGMQSMARMAYDFSTMRQEALRDSKVLGAREIADANNIHDELNKFGKGRVNSAIDLANKGGMAGLYWLGHVQETWVFDAVKKQSLARGATEAKAIENADFAVMSTIVNRDKMFNSSFIRDKIGMNLGFILQGYWNKLFNMKYMMLHKPYLDFVNSQGAVGKVSGLSKLVWAGFGALAMSLTATQVGHFFGAHGKRKDDTWGEELESNALASPFSGMPFVQQVSEPLAKQIVGHKKGSQDITRMLPSSAPLIADYAKMVEDVLKKGDDPKAGKLIDMLMTMKGIGGGRQVDKSLSYLLTNKLEIDINNEQYMRALSRSLFGYRKKNPPATILQPQVEK